MKQKILFCLAFSISLFACQKADTGTSTTNNALSSAPETKPQYDNTSFGVYKGVIVGSSGYIIFRINNGDNIVKGYLTIDNQKDTLSTTATLVPGQALSNILFTGRISSMKVSANANGTNASLSNVQINGHNNVTGVIVHENSTKQVLCYEGTFTGTASGIINATRVGSNNYDTTYLLAKVQSVNDTALYGGFNQVIHDTTRVNLYFGGPTPAFKIVGIFRTDSLNKSTFSGTWTSIWYGNGQFTAHRTY